MQKYFIEAWLKHNPRMHGFVTTVASVALNKPVDVAHVTLLAPFKTRDIVRVESQLEKQLGELDEFTISLTEPYVYEDYVLLKAQLTEEVYDAREQLAYSAVKSMNIRNIHAAAKRLYRVPPHVTIAHEEDALQRLAYKKRIDSFCREQDSLPYAEVFDKITILKKGNESQAYKIHKVYDLKTKSFLNREEALQQIDVLYSA